MIVDLLEADFSHKPALRQMLELYQYEFSAMEQRDLDEHGFFGYRWLDHYWTEDDRFPFVIRCDGKLAGFALVRIIASVPELKMDTAYSIAEFFVMEKYRRRGIGRSCALRLFERYAGRWVLTVYDQNESAKKFWQSVISETADDLSMNLMDNLMPARWLYSFSCAPRPTVQVSNR